MIKALKKLWIKRIYLNIIKAIYDKLIANYILNGGKQKHFLWNQEQKKEVSVSTLIKYSAQTFSQSNQARGKKGIKIGTEEVKLSLFADDMGVHLKYRQ
jgi:hypothetical protein